VDSCGIENIQKLLRGEKRVECGSCLWWKTVRCSYWGRSDIAPPLKTDLACPDGLIALFIGSNVVVKRGEKLLTKPFRYLNTSKAKNELAEALQLEDRVVEDALAEIVDRHDQLKRRPEEPKAKKELEKPVDPEITAKAEALLKEPDLLERFMAHSDKWLVMDEAVRKCELLTDVSAFGDYPLNLSLQGWASIGKTATSVFTASYFPDAWFLGYQTPKALIHEKGQYDEERGKWIVDLQGKILLFLDEPPIETLAMLKPLLSHDKFEIDYKFVSKELETVTTTLRGWPACMFSVVESKYVEEFTSRWLTATPQVSPEKIRAVLRLKAEMAARPEEYELGEEFQVWKRAFEILGEGIPHRVVIPFAPKLVEGFRARQPTDMRFFLLLLALIKASTVLHARQRERRQDGRLLAAEQDLEIAQEAFREIEKTTVFGVGENVLNFYEEVVLALGDVAAYESLTARFMECYGRPIGRYQLRENYVKPLENLGLLCEESDPEDKRKVLFRNAGPLRYRSLLDWETTEPEEPVGARRAAGPGPIEEWMA